jgi:hypothetical protein
VTTINTTHCLYYANVPNPALRDQEMLASFNNKAMESVRKEHMKTLHKRVFICDPTLGVEFLQQIQVHYNMNPNPKMMMEKL